MYFETHAHYDDKAFDEDRDAILPMLNANGIHCIIDPGCDIASSKKALSLAEKYVFIFAAVGIHPEEINSVNENSMTELFQLALHPKCKAIGEIGLDYHWDTSKKEVQKNLFRMQLQLACQLDMPVIIHDREAHEDCLTVLQDFPDVRGVFHCFSGSTEMAAYLIRRGWYLGFDGPITYKNAKKAISVLEICPLDRILLETDSPYMSPVPVRGTRNNSENLKYICAKAAEVKGITPAQMAIITAANAENLFLHK